MPGYNIRRKTTQPLPRVVLADISNYTDSANYRPARVFEYLNLNPCAWWGESGGHYTGI